MSGDVDAACGTHATYTYAACPGTGTHTHVTCTYILRSGAAARTRTCGVPALAKKCQILRSNWDLSISRDDYPDELDHPDHAELWRRFLEGEYDPENPPAEIREWIRMYRNSPRSLGLSSPSYTIVPAGLADDSHEEDGP